MRKRNSYPRLENVDDDPEPIGLQLMQPAVAGRHLRGEDRLTGADEPGRLTPVPRQCEGINMAAL
jgi:hypothetical protein